MKKSLNHRSASKQASALCIELEAIIIALNNDYYYYYYYYYYTALSKYGVLGPAHER